MSWPQALTELQSALRMWECHRSIPACDRYRPSLEYKAERAGNLLGIIYHITKIQGGEGWQSSRLYPDIGAQGRVEFCHKKAIAALCS